MTTYVEIAGTAGATTADLFPKMDSDIANIDKVSGGSEIFTEVGAILKDGTIRNDLTLFSRGYVAVKGLGSVRFNTQSAASSGTCFFEKDGTFITGYDGHDFSGTGTIVVAEVDVPENAEYAITCLYTAKIPDDYFFQKKLAFTELGKSNLFGNTFNISDRNTNTYAGSVNTAIDALLAVKPDAQFVFISNFTEDFGWGENAKSIIDMQRQVAEYWQAPFLDLSKICRMNYRDGSDQLHEFVPDGTHPGGDSAGGYRLVNLIARYMKQFLEPIFDDWSTKKIAWYGTSIPAGYPSESVDGAQYPKVAASLLGATCDNYAQSSSTFRLTKVNGTVAANPSFLNPSNATANYITHMIDLIGTANEPDLFVFDHGRNDRVVDVTDFKGTWNNKYM